MFLWPILQAMKFLLFALISLPVFSASYSEVYPEYFEYCASTQLKYQKAYFEGAVGGPGGHGFLYINGLCKDYSKDYPQVKPCDEKDNHKGVGISLDSDFTNVMWVAVPGRELILNGDQEASRIISHDDVNKLAEKSYKLKIFENVKLKSEFTNIHAFNSKEYQEAAAIFSIGTDIAINWGRELRCIKIPINKSDIPKAAEYLNKVNNEYYFTGKEFKWSGFSNNCAHLAKNVGHQLGINKESLTDKNILTQLKHIVTPSNYYLHLVDSLLLKKEVKLNKDGNYSPSQVGVLIQKFPAFMNSDMFDTDKLVAITLPRRNLKKVFATPKSYDKYLNEKEYTNITENALSWKYIYEQKSLGLMDDYREEKLQLIHKILEN